MARLEGVGIGLRRAFHEEILATTRRVDWLEIVAENFAGLARRPAYVLERCAERWPIVSHGVALSVGGRDSMDAYVANLRPLLERLQPPFFSDHLCYSTIGGRQTFDLLPLPFHAEAVRHVAQRAREIQERAGYPLLLENITYYAVMPGSEMSEPDFVRTVLEEANVGLLLDVNNLYVNAVNHGTDPIGALDRLPLDRVRQIHLAGFTREGSLLLDTHSRPVADTVWSLYREVLRRAGPVPTLIEWDQSIPSLDAVLDEADRARAILDEARRAIRADDACTGQVTQHEGVPHAA
jgi:uncharacterized protein (UPF0276 family)